MDLINQKIFDILLERGEPLPPEQAGEIFEHRVVHHLGRMTGITPTRFEPELKSRLGELNRHASETASNIRNHVESLFPEEEGHKIVGIVHTNKQHHFDQYFGKKSDTPHDADCLVKVQHPDGSHSHIGYSIKYLSDKTSNVTLSGRHEQPIRKSFGFPEHMELTPSNLHDHLTSLGSDGLKKCIKSHLINRKDDYISAMAKCSKTTGSISVVHHNDILDHRISNAHGFHVEHSGGFDVRVRATAKGASIPSTICTLNMIKDGDKNKVRTKAPTSAFK